MDKRLLIIDDDLKLVELLKEYFGGYAFQVHSLPDGSGVLEALRADPPDIVILDIMLPREDGLEILRKIHSRSAIPVIMLTAKGEDSDRIVGLELGADDYLPKPFNPRELLARIKAVLRRGKPEGSRLAAEGEPELMEVGGIALNTARQTLIIENEEVELSSTEFKLLLALMQNPDRVLSRDALMSLAWGKDFIAYDRTIDVHISKLRAIFRRHPAHIRRIKTVWGTGYKFVAAP